MKKNCLDLLPLALYQFIREFILDFSFVKGCLDKESFISWRNFLNCCNSSNFREIKYYLVYYNLNDVCSRLYVKYYTNPSPVTTDVVSTVMRKVFASKHQISLKFLYSVGENSRFNDVYIEQYSDAFMSVHGVVFPGLSELTSSSCHYFDHYYFLSLRHCDTLRDVSALKNIKILDLSACFGLENLGMLSNCLEVNLSSTTIKGSENLEKLTKVKKLILSDCVYQESPPSLVNEVNEVPERSIIDISCSFQNDYLSFSRRLVVKDPIIFRYVKELSLFNCKNIHDLSIFDQIINLDICGLTQIDIPLPEDNKLKIIKLDGTVFHSVGIIYFPEKQKEILQVHIYNTFPMLSSSCSSVIDSEDSFDDHISGLSSLIDFSTDGLYCISFHHIQIASPLSSTSFPSIRKVSFTSCIKTAFSEKIPFLTDLTFINVKELKPIDYSFFPNLINLQFENYIHDTIRFEINCPSLKRIFIKKCGFRKLDVYCFSNLKILEVRCSLGISLFPIRIYGEKYNIDKLKIDVISHPVIRFGKSSRMNKKNKCIIF
jgi:hypothetical protein